MRIRNLLLLLLPALLAACESQPKERTTVAAGPARARAQPKKEANEAHASLATPAAAAEEKRGSVTPHPMKFVRISEEEMQRKIERDELAPTLLFGRFLLGAGDDFRSTRLYYRSPGYADGWLGVEFEPVGEWLDSQDVALDTVRLEPGGPPAVMATFRTSGSLRHWSATNEGINIIDASKEPVLVLTAGTVSHEYAYGGDDDADTTDAAVTDNSVETNQSQAIAVRKQLIVVSPAEVEEHSGLAPAPAGTYRYRRGKMIRLSK